jgi:hypothetical protein
MTNKSTTLERPRYFPGQVITADDLTADQSYLREKLKRHNRMLHGWGIVCGAEVEFVEDTTQEDKHKRWFVQVKPGYILSPCGCEILIEQPLCCDLRIKCMATATPPPKPCADAMDQTVAPPKAAAAVNAFVVIRCREVGLRPVRVNIGGCGCGTNPCENSRLVDSYEVCVLEALPPNHSAPKPPPGNCLAPPNDPWVALAKATVKSDGTVALDASFAPDKLAR